MPDKELQKKLLEQIDREMRNLETFQEVPLFYDPIHYVLDLGGKKIRPLLLMLSCGACGGEAGKAANAAAAVELLHNFTLVHDDIMDNDNTRRGKPTVHTRWDNSTAILAGDGLLGFAFQKLLQTEGTDTALLARRFTEAMIIICEGQALDKMFEQQEKVSAAAYLDMIDRKTAALIQLSCELGARIAGADAKTVENMKAFGHALGMGFQVQDDILDITADEQALGKKVGSDFEMRKQTILTIMLKEKLPEKEFNALDFKGYREALKKEGVLQKAHNLTDDYFNKAFEMLDALETNRYAAALHELSNSIRGRQW